MRTLCLLMMTAFSAALGIAIISPFLPELIGNHGANGFWIGMVFAGFGISRGIITPFIGKVSDKVGRKIFVASGLMIYTAVSFFYTKADSVYALVLVRLVHGLSAGMILPIVMAYVGELARQGKEGLTMGMFHTVFYFGVATGPLIGGELAERCGFASVFYAMAALAGFTLFLVLFFLPDVKTKDSMKDAKTVSFKDLFNKDHIKVILIMAFVSVTLFSVFMSFLPSIGIKDSLDMIHIGFIISFAIFVAGFLQIPLGKFADSHSRWDRLLQAALGISISMMATFTLPLCPNFKALLLSGFFMGLGVAVAVPAISNLSVSIGKKIGMGRWMGLLSSVMSAALVVAPIAAGIIMDRLGINSVFYSVGTFAFFCVLICAHYLLRKQKLLT
ncbi:MAG: MFS transporter [Candidatus Omnitrophica bacterium]|nr:MFS transporter [Candidatus Omnitrophota bacterium]MDD5430447.1 MFS transporter [Candidatus Omnitrophota bacterium]